MPQKNEKTLHSFLRSHAIATVKPLVISEIIKKQRKSYNNKHTSLQQKNDTIVPSIDRLSAALVVLSCCLLCLVISMSLLHTELISRAEFANFLLVGAN